MADYANRLLIPLSGSSPVNFYTVSGVKIAAGYARVVIGGRGPYIEFNEADLISKSMHIASRKHFYFVEWRTNDDNVMVYQQKEPVDYADYRIGMFYISPFDLRLSGGRAVICDNPNQIELLWED